MYKGAYIEIERKNGINKFMNNIDFIINDTMKNILDLQEIDEDVEISHCNQKYCVKCFFNKICCFSF